ncbi:MAG: cupin domain-containing protein [Bacteroidia bacterium]|nr:cupin domain-containing protein [Bacteroidia bacterium]
MENKVKPGEMEWISGKVKGFQGKDLFKADKGTVKLVKVDPFVSYPEHVHPDKTEYAWVISGNPEFEIDNRHFSGEPGDFFIFPIAKRHAIQNKTDKDCLLLIGAIKKE